MKKYSIAILFIFCALLTFSKEKESFKFRSDKTTIELSEGKEKTVLKGNARIETGNTKIIADKIMLFGKDFRYAQCEGKIRVKDYKKGIYLKCEKLFFDREKKISRIEGYAEMIDKENNLVVKGNFLEDSQDSDTTIIQIGVRIIKDDIVCRCETAIYNRKNKELELSGSPYVTKKGDEYRATRILINIDTDDIKLEGSVSGKISQQGEQ